MNFRITNVRNTLRSQIRSQWLGELGEELVLFKAYHSLKQRHIVMLAYMSDRELMHDNYVSEFSVFRRSRSPDDRIAWIRFVRSMQGDRRRVLRASDHIQRGGYAAPLVYFQGSSGRAKVLLLADGSFYRGSLCRLL